SLEVAPTLDHLERQPFLTGQREVQAVPHEEVGRGWCPQVGEDVNRGPADVANDLGDACQVLIAEANPEPGQPPVSRHLLLVDRGRSDPHAARLGLPGYALTQLRDVAHRLVMMDERL